MIDLSKITFGYELELGDILRSREVPAEFGKWEYAECDIVSIQPANKESYLKACDPQGTHPPHGGEINIHPANSVAELHKRIMDTIQWFRDQGDTPSASCVNHGHVHVRVPGLRDDIGALKKLIQFIVEHQDETIKNCYGYQVHPDMKQCRTATRYLKWDGGRRVPQWLCDNIVEQAENFDDFIRFQCRGIDGIRVMRPPRYGINSYCLKHTETVEFRCFRASLDSEEILNSLLFVEHFMQAALSTMSYNPPTGPFPAFEFNLEHYLGWENTRYGPGRGKKDRQYVNIS